MSLLNKSPTRISNQLPTMTRALVSSMEKPKKNSVFKNICTPFCDAKAPCAEHHELVLSLMNCNDCQGAKSNVLAFQKCVMKCLDEGWEKDDVVPDPSEALRFPLVHLACAFGKCLALEWLLSYGFDPDVKSETTGQFALQRGIIGISRSRNKGTTKELLPRFRRILARMQKQLMFHDEVNSDTPLHTAALMLTTVDYKPQFFESCIEAIAKEAFKMDCPARTILDAINNEGRTALHVLASSNKKVEFCAGAIRALVSAGADKTIRDNNGLTALDIAFAGGVQNIVHELLRDGEQAVYSSGFYSELDGEHEPLQTTTDFFPSPSLTDDSDVNWSDRPSSHSSCSQMNDEPTSLPTMTLMGIKRERVAESEDSCSSPCDCSPAEEDGLAPVVSTSSPAVLKYLGDAGLLGDVSALVARARAQDEANMRKIQNKAKEIDVQIKNKEQSIQRMRQELNVLKNKRKECDSDFAQLKKRMHCCENAMKELPNI